MTNRNDSHDQSRRRFFAGAGCALGAAALAQVMPRVAHADDLPHLTTDDPTAKALNYTEDASKAPAPHEAGTDCSTCTFFHGGKTGYGACDLFPGKATNAKGWCSGFAKKS